MSKNKSDYSILTVDDSELITELIRVLLESEGYHFNATEKSTEAIQLMAEYHYDLVLLDIEMPEMSGIEVLQEMKTRHFLKKTKVVMLTGNTDAAYLSQCISLGAAGYILKPFQHDDIKEKIWSYLKDY